MKNTEDKIKQSKAWRNQLDGILQEMKAQQAEDRGETPRGGEDQRHLALSATHIEDAIMRQGMRLKALNEASPGSQPNPYPDSYDASNARVAPTADGLKL